MARGDPTKLGAQFSYWTQPAWAPIWRGGRIPRKLKKRFNHNGIYLEPWGFRGGWKTAQAPLVISSAEVGIYTDVSWVSIHIGKRVNGRWKPRHVWSEPRG